MAKVSSQEYISGAAEVLIHAMDAVPAIDASRGAERVERIRWLAWALEHAAALLKRAADVEEAETSDA